MRPPRSDQLAIKGSFLEVIAHCPLVTTHLIGDTIRRLARSPNTTGAQSGGRNPTDPANLPDCQKMNVHNQQKCLTSPGIDRTYNTSCEYSNLKLQHNRGGKIRLVLGLVWDPLLGFPWMGKYWNQWKSAFLSRYPVQSRPRKDSEPFRPCARETASR